MSQRYVEAILKYLSDKHYQPLKPRQLARKMGVAEEEYGSFREAVKILRDSGRVVMGAKNALMLPEPSGTIVGFFSAHRRGFGFVIPETPNSHGDLFIPPEATAGAMSGDQVTAKVTSRGRRDGEDIYRGEIVEILRRGENRFVGTLEKAEDYWFVMPDGREMTTPIVIKDVGEAGPKVGTKVVAEILSYPKKGELPTGVIVENLGAQGELEVETRSVIRAHGLAEEFSEEALADARKAIEQFDGEDTRGRRELFDETLVTIDPPDARDYDDAVSVRNNDDGTTTLGVHIADVSHFVREGTNLDADAKERGTSTYFPRRVLPMLPEVLSNGVCSLQEGEPRYAKSVFITYDESGQRVDSDFAETVIRSSHRLTYEEAQRVIDGRSSGVHPETVRLLNDLHALARRIEKRRREDGMIHLDLPEVELVFDANDHVADAVPEDQSYTHTIIEMCMVEANEAVAELFERLNRHYLRRIHPEPEDEGGKQLGAFVRACGHKIPRNLTRKDVQQLLEAVKGRPESYAVNLAVLKTFQQAEYSPMKIGHFALASRHYCHFTSPIRRYPDLTVHRLLTEYLRGELKGRPPEDLDALVKLGEHCSAAERRSQAAEDELREVLVLQFLEDKVGENFPGVITGVTNFGVFVQLERFLIDGLIRLPDLGDDWWEVQPQYGQVRGEMSGKRYRIGDEMEVRISNVDVPSRQLSLIPAKEIEPQGRRGGKGGKKGKPKGGSKGKPKSGSKGKPKNGDKPAKQKGRSGGRKGKSKTRTTSKGGRSKKSGKGKPSSGRKR
ncbi:MAG: ribonuclease R [Phycisphaerae bacterium]